MGFKSGHSNLRNPHPVTIFRYLVSHFGKKKEFRPKIKLFQFF